MMHLNPHELSPEEVQFLKHYSAAVKRDFYVLTCALQVMMKDGLAVTNPVTATRLAQELQRMHAEFDGKLIGLALQNGWRMKGRFAPEPPPIEMLVRIVQASFFKLIEKKKALKDPTDMGWFSGQPVAWETTYKQAPVNSPELNAVLGPLFNAIAKLFKHKLPPPKPEYADEQADDYDDGENFEDFDDDDFEQWADD